MATLTTPDLLLNKVVIAYLDGRRPRGCVYDFSPLKDTLRLVSEGAGQQQKGTEVALKDLKAVFFVKDFRGDSKYNESKKVPDGKPGRKIEVTFSDGEKIVGTTQAYNPKSKGFFVFPADTKSNSFRIYVVNWNVRRREVLVSQRTRWKRPILNLAPNGSTPSTLRLDTPTRKSFNCRTLFVT